MTNTNKIIVGIAIVAVLVVGFILGTLGGHEATPTPAPVKDLGAVVYDFSNLAGGIRVGMNGSSIRAIYSGTCNLFSAGDTIAATSSVIASCLAPGVIAGDRVFVSLATSTAGNNDNFVAIGASASSSSGYIAVSLLNLAGGASQTTKAGTSTQYWVVRP